VPYSLSAYLSKKGYTIMRIPMPRKYSVFLLFLMLAGCGTLKVDVDFGETPGVSESSFPSTSTGVPAVSGSTPTGTVTPSATRISASSETTTAPAVLRATAVASGKAHTCIVTDAGRVKCWGNNEHRQLGNGGMVNSNIPVDVIGLAEVKSVTAGWEHTCALTIAGGVKCWGYNQNGELGNGEMSDSGVPVDVSGLSSGVRAIEAGDDHTCAVTDKGEVKCWGYNRYGQLGDGSTTSRGVPVAVQGLPVRAAAVAAGWGHTCVLTDDKSVQCWGNDEYGQLGYGQTEDYRFTPVDVTGLVRNVVRISADGGQTCVLTIYGGVSCWGNNKYGQLGDGSSEIRNSPVQVTGLTQDAVDIAAGWNHTCSLVGGRGMKCWGWNYFGQLGDGTKASRAEPVLVYGLSERIDAMGVGWAHTCVVTGLGGVKCWGQNESGQLGDGTNLDSQVPLTVVGMGGGSGPSPTEEIPTTSTPTAAAKKSVTSTPKAMKTSTPTPAQPKTLSSTPSPGGMTKPTGTFTPKL
jgi:alpha-tubulin suppressor-like RCC1 family protein